MTTTVHSPSTHFRPELRIAASAPVRMPGNRRPSVALGLLVSAQFVVMLDTSIVNVALPSIQADFRLGPTAVTWVVNAYVLTFGSLLLLSGRAADLFGRRRMFIAGSALFTAGTLLAAFAFSPGCSWLAASSRAPAQLPSVPPRCPCSCSPSPVANAPGP